MIYLAFFVIAILAVFATWEWNERKELDKAREVAEGGWRKERIEHNATRQKCDEVGRERDELRTGAYDIGFEDGWSKGIRRAPKDGEAKPAIISRRGVDGRFQSKHEVKTVGKGGGTKKPGNPKREPKKGTSKPKTVTSRKK